MSTHAPVLMIGLDAAEVTLIERLCSEGKLPTLQSLREKGCFGVLETNAKLFAGGVWPTFYTSNEVPWHGIYHNKLWRQENMRCEVAHESWLPGKPFWEYPDSQTYRTSIIDVPMTLTLSDRVNGIYLAGWGTHDLIMKGSIPSDLWKKLEKKFDPPIVTPELFGPQSAKTLLRLRDNLLKGTEQLVKISEFLLDQDSWDLFLVVFGAAHRGGHYLWDLSQIDTGGLPSNSVNLLDRGLQDIYQALDEGVSRLIEKAPHSARILMFALHGMGRNPGWSDRCGEIITRIQQEGKGDTAKTGFLYKLRSVLPWQLIRQVTTRLPQSVLDRLVSLWSAGMFDWDTTRYFPLPMDYAGYVRINVRGREPQGIVDPGAEYRGISRELEDAFLSFKDIESGEPIVKKVYHMDDLGPEDAPFRHFLPDLVITWGNVSAIHSSAIVSDKYGEMRWDNRGKLPSGRSGNHQNSGWFIAAGEGIRPGSVAHGYGIVDLVPTVFRWLGAEPPEDFQGQPIPDICE